MSALLLNVPAPAARQSIVWETGHVISQTLSSQPAGADAAPIGSGAVAIPIYRSSNVIVIDVAQVRYTLSESANRHPLVVVVNDNLQFYRDGNWFVITDSKDNRHKFSLIGATQMPVTQAAPCELAPNTVQPLSAQLLFNKAVRDQNCGNLGLALSEYTEFIRLYPGDANAVRAQYCTGRIYYNEGNLDEAVNAFEAVSETYPADAVTRPTALYIYEGNGAEES